MRKGNKCIYLNKALHYLHAFDLLGAVVQVGVVYLPSITVMFLPLHKISIQ